MKAMILAAGRGERLRPLTDHVPKPLLEVGGKALLAWHLERLAAAGFGEVVINVSHLAERIVDAFGDGNRFGLRIAYSRETEPLETAGGIAHARALLGDAAFVLLNADVFCDYDLARLRRRSLDAQLAHLLLVPNPPHRPEGDFSLRAGLVGNGDAPRYTYAGVALMSPALVARVGGHERAALGPILRDAAERGALSGELHQGRWCDAGTAQRLAELDRELNGSPDAEC